MSIDGTSDIFLIIGMVFAGLAALLHGYIFIMESVTWTDPKTWKRFGLHSQDEAETIRPMALNQGFYNLFLGVVTAIGLVLLPHIPLGPTGLALVFAGTGSMLAAALVLIISNPRLARSAITQGLFPLLAVITLAVGALTA